MGSDWAGMKMRIEKADADLTITASPANVTSVTPYVNETQNQFIGIPISIEALRFVDCPTDSVMVFDHWVPGANTFVTDPYAASTTVVVTAAGSADITAVYVDDRKCGDECHPIIPEDLNGDCLVNLIDLSRLVSVWLNDNTVK